MLQFLMRAVAALPLSVVHAVGALLGWLVYFVSPTYRRNLRENMARAGYHDAAMRRAAISAAGELIAEIPAIWFRRRDAVLPLVRQIHGQAHVEAARAAGKGIVFLTAHLGCFEITAQLAGAHMPITVLYRAPKQTFLQPLIDGGRAQHNVRLAPANVSGVRELIAALKRGEAVGILPDQVPSRGEGEWAELFGYPAYTMTLAARLAARADTVTLLAFGERLPRGAGYVVHVRPMPELRADESPARWLNRAVEELIRARPEQYLWGYNRYKVPRGAVRP